MTKVWQISKEINLAEESLANFSTCLIVIFTLKSCTRRVRCQTVSTIHILENDGWWLLSITERTSELVEAVAEEGNLLLRVPSISGK